MPAPADAEYISNLENLLRSSTELISTTDLKVLRRKAVELAKSLLGLDFSTLMVLTPDRSHRSRSTRGR